MAVPVLPPQPAEGVDYFDVAGAEGLRFFRCAPHEMTLSMGGCGARWRAAQVSTGPDDDQACRSCAIGASHAGSVHVSYSRLFAASICPRCRLGATRIIGGRICVNCYNREREVLAGRNARGNVPTMLLRDRPLHAVDVITVINGVVRRRHVCGVADRLEVVIQTLRSTTGVIWFSRAPRIPDLPQRDLFLGRGIGGGRRVIGRAVRMVRRPMGYTAQGEFWPAVEFGTRPPPSWRAAC